MRKLTFTIRAAISTKFHSKQIQLVASVEELGFSFKKKKKLRRYVLLIVGHIARHPDMADKVVQITSYFRLGWIRSKRTFGDLLKVKLKSGLRRGKWQFCFDKVRKDTLIYE